jgi:hypothetical protein
MTIIPHFVELVLLCLAAKDSACLTAAHTDTPSNNGGSPTALLP